MTDYDWLMKIRLGVALQNDLGAEYDDAPPLSDEEFAALCARLRLAGEIVAQGRDETPPYLWPSWFKESRP